MPLKAEAQLDVQALQRARERLVTERTALINQLRALLLERGIILPQRRRAVAAWIDEPVADGKEDPLSARIWLLVTDMREEWAELDRRITVFDDEFAIGRGDQSPVLTARRGAPRNTPPSPQHSAAALSSKSAIPSRATLRRTTTRPMSSKPCNTAAVLAQDDPEHRHYRHLYLL